MKQGRDRGALALVLHTHMPYVEGFGTWPFGEEWLWEAVAGVYIPLLDVLEGAPVTVSLTPVLCDQLEAMRGEAGDRYLRFLREIRAPIHAEDSTGLDATGKPELAAELRRAAGDYLHADEEFERRGRDLLAAFAGLGTELWTSSATHAVLPLIATDAGLRLQVGAGVARTSAASAKDGAAGSGCRSARTSPGSSATWPSTACASSASTRPTRSATARSTTSSRSLPRRARSPCRSTGRRSSSSGARPAIPRTRTTATTTAARCTT